MADLLQLSPIFRSVPQYPPRALGPVLLTSRLAFYSVVRWHTPYIRPYNILKCLQMQQRERRCAQQSIIIRWERPRPLCTVPSRLKGGCSLKCCLLDRKLTLTRRAPHPVTVEYASAAAWPEKCVKARASVTVERCPRSVYDKPAERRAVHPSSPCHPNQGHSSYRETGGVWSMGGISIRSKPSSYEARCSLLHALINVLIWPDLGKTKLNFQSWIFLKVNNVLWQQIPLNFVQLQEGIEETVPTVLSLITGVAHVMPHPSYPAATGADAVTLKLVFAE